MLNHKKMPHMLDDRQGISRRPNKNRAPLLSRRHHTDAHRAMEQENLVIGQGSTEGAWNSVITRRREASEERESRQTNWLIHLRCTSEDSDVGTLLSLRLEMHEVDGSHHPWKKTIS
jgi:hypothetical protein